MDGIKYNKLKEFYNGYYGHKSTLKLWDEGAAGKNNFLVDVDEYAKHLVPGNVLFLGCSVGHRVWGFQQRGWDAHGCDISEWAIKNAVTSNCRCYDLRDMRYKEL